MVIPLVSRFLNPGPEGDRGVAEPTRGAGEVQCRDQPRSALQKAPGGLESSGAFCRSRQYRRYGQNCHYCHLEPSETRKKMEVRRTASTADTQKLKIGLSNRHEQAGRQQTVVLFGSRIAVQLPSSGRGILSGQRQVDLQPQLREGYLCLSAAH